MESDPSDKSNPITPRKHDLKEDGDSSPVPRSPDADPQEGRVTGHVERNDQDEGKKDEEKIDTSEIAEEEVDDDVDRKLCYSLEKALEDIDKLATILSSTSNENDSSEIPEYASKLMDFVEAKVAEYCNDLGEGKAKWSQEPEVNSFLEIVDRLSQLATVLEPSKCKEKFASLINRVGSIQQRALSFLEDEFRELLDECQPTDLEKEESVKSKQESTEESDQSIEEDHSFGYPNDIVSILNKIAKEMISCGYESECCQVYIVTRRNSFEELFNKFGFENISIDDVQKMQWEALEREIVKWIKTFKQCASVHFHRELRLAEAVFAGYPSIATHLFYNLTRSMLIQILNFSEAVAMSSKRSAEKLFKFLDMFETLRDTTPTMDRYFKNEDGANQLRTEINTARSRIGEAIVSMFSDLENSIKSDTGKNPVPGGAVHPLTSYTVNYLKYACEYKETLEQVFKEHLKIERADSNNRAEFQGQGNRNDSEKESSPFSIQVTKVMDLLDSNLEAKSKLYKDVSLSFIFMMNNGRYILQKVKGSAEINELTGDNWRRKRSSELRQYHKNYQRETWSKVLGCFRDEGLNVHGKVSKPELKERFKTFNAMFEEIHKTQSAWIVKDEQLQSELRVSIAAVVIPAYRSFLGRHSQHFTAGRQSEKYVKYQPEDLETYIDELFDGTPATTGRRKQ
ncbi:Exocyst subunit Exo70 family protein [Psidium guajava]|nr:Exocyst subunit Exo70 family protein [Psidium guajava]